MTKDYKLDFAVSLLYLTISAFYGIFKINKVLIFEYYLCICICVFKTVLLFFSDINEISHLKVYCAFLGARIYMGRNS